MALTVSTNFNVADQEPVTVVGQGDVVLPPVGVLGAGHGRLVHPTLGSYDYVVTPDEVVNVAGDVFFPPIMAHSTTIGGAVDTMWPGYVRDAKVIERWKNGEVGCPIGHLYQLWQMLANHPDIASGQYILWSPSYINARTYRVAIVGLRSGGSEVTIDMRLASYGYAPQPVELEMRVLGYAN